MSPNSIEEDGIKRKKWANICRPRRLLDKALILLWKSYKWRIVVRHRAVAQIT